MACFGGGSRSSPLERAPSVPLRIGNAHRTFLTGRQIAGKEVRHGVEKDGA